MNTVPRMKAPKGLPATPPRFLLKMILAMNAPLPEPPVRFEKPDNWDSISMEERRKLRIEHWKSGSGVEFVNAAAKERYQDRVNLLADAIDINKKPARVPVATFPGVYPLRRVGMTPKDLFYDRFEDSALAHIQYHLDMDTDFNHSNTMFSGPALDTLGFKVFEWPGGSLPAERSYQFNEFEFMKAEEYDDFLNDPSDAMLRKFMPRMFSNLEGLREFPQFSSGYLGFPNLYQPFGTPAVKKALRLLVKAGEQFIQTLPANQRMIDGPTVLGFPSFYGIVSLAPFDALSDVLRSTRGIMKDMYRHPDKVIAACDKFVKIIVQNQLLTFGSSPLAFIPLHKGADRFMSEEQFETFYWPSLKKVMLALAEDGYIPMPFAEGSYNKRLKYIADFPANACVWHFDQTDMVKASKALENTCAITGNVPASITTTGTPETMTAYCKDLIESVGPTGNFILNNGCQIDEGKDENIKAMIESVKKFVV